MDTEPEDSFTIDPVTRITIALETMPLHLLALRVADYAAAKDWHFAALASMALSKRAVALTGDFVEKASREQAENGDS